MLMLLHICWISNKQPLAYTQNDFKGDNMPILCLQLLHLPPSGRKIIIVALNNTKYLKSVCISVALRFIKCNGKTCQQKACTHSSICLFLPVTITWRDFKDLVFHYSLTLCHKRNMLVWQRETNMSSPRTPLLLSHFLQLLFCLGLG